MIVVADTTPLNYLVLIGEIELLSTLYETVLIPQEVHGELQRPMTPATVRAWASNLPAWCEVRRLTSFPDATLNQILASATPSSLHWSWESIPCSSMKAKDDGKHYAANCG